MLLSFVKRTSTRRLPWNSKELVSQLRPSLGQWKRRYETILIVFCMHVVNHDSPIFSKHSHISSQRVLLCSVRLQTSHAIRCPLGILHGTRPPTSELKGAGQFRRVTFGSGENRTGFGAELGKHLEYTLDTSKLLR